MNTGPERSVEQQLHLLEALELDRRPAPLEAGDCILCRPAKVMEDLCFYYGALFVPENEGLHENCTRFRCPVENCVARVQFQGLFGCHVVVGHTHHSCSIPVRNAVPLPESLQERLRRIMRKEVLPTKEDDVENFVRGVLQVKYGLFLPNIKPTLYGMLLAQKEATAQILNDVENAQDSVFILPNQLPQPVPVSTKCSASRSTTPPRRERVTVDDSAESNSPRPTIEAEDVQCATPSPVSKQQPPAPKKTTRSSLRLATAQIENEPSKSACSKRSKKKKGQLNACVCGSHHLDEDRFWIACDKCDDWFEVIPACVGTNPELCADLVWKCPSCQPQLVDDRTPTKDAGLPCPFDNKEESPSRRTQTTATTPITEDTHGQESNCTTNQKATGHIGKGVAETSVLADPPADDAACSVPCENRYEGVDSSATKRNLHEMISYDYRACPRPTKCPKEVEVMAKKRRIEQTARKASQYAGTAFEDYINPEHSNSANHVTDSDVPRRASKSDNKQATHDCERDPITLGKTLERHKSIGSGKKNVTKVCGDTESSQVFWPTPGGNFMAPSLDPIVTQETDVNDPVNALEKYAMSNPPTTCVDELLFEYEANAAFDLVDQLDFGPDLDFTRKATREQLRRLEQELEENYAGMMPLLDEYLRRRISSEETSWARGSKQRTEQVLLGDHEEKNFHPQFGNLAEVSLRRCDDGPRRVTVVVDERAQVTFDPSLTSDKSRMLYNMSKRTVNISVLDDGGEDICCIIEKALKLLSKCKIDDVTLAPLYRARQLVTTRRKKLRLEKVLRGRQLLRRISNRINLLENSG